MVNICGSESPPPGAGLFTVTCTVPGVATSDATIVVVSWVALTKLVVLAAPFHMILEAAIYPVPLTVNVKLVEPAFADEGTKPAGVAVRSFIVGLGETTVKVSEFERPPPGA